MKKNYYSSKSNRFLFLILGLLCFKSQIFAQLPLPPVLATSNVPEASQYGVMYQFDIPTNGNFSSAITYAINNSTVSALSYNRVAYFMQLDGKWVWVSMNKFNTTNAELGIPYGGSGIAFQQQVTNMNVFSSVGSGVTNTLSASGNIEMWPDCYGTGLGLGVIGGNASTYDFNDTRSPGTNCHGSFQIHNFGAGQTIFGYNSFTNASNDDLGIGNNTLNSHPDWTFMNNAGTYTTKTLYICVDQGLFISTQPSSLTVSACKNATIAPLSVSVTVNTGTVTGYTWYSNAVNSNTGGTVVATNPSSLTTNSYTPSTTFAGTLYYYCSITSSTGGTVTSSPSGAITINAIPTIAVNSGSICSGNSFTIIPSGANTYTYSSGSSIVTPSITTSYTVTGTSSLGCLSSVGAISSVTVNTTPTITVNSGSICSGNSFTILPSGASTYTYSGGSSIVSPGTTSTYTVNGTSSQGCISASGAVSSVTVNATPTLAISNGTICSGASFILSPTGASTYTYSSGSATVSPAGSTIYSITGTSAQGCLSAPKSVTVNVNITPTVSVNSGSICLGESFTMTPSGAATYTYSSGSSVVVPASNTSYTITGTSVEGCNANAISTVTVNANPVVTVNSGSICNGSSFTMTPTGATSYTYSSGSSIVAPITNTSYTVTGANASGCSNTAVSSITVNTNPVVTVNSGSICNGSSFTMTPTGAASYVYSSGSSVVAPVANTSYTVTGTNAAGCSANVVSTVTVNSIPVVTVNSGSICNGASFTMIPSGASTYTYSSGSSVVAPTSNTSYTVIGTSVEGCNADAISTVTVNANPVVTVNSGSICNGFSFTMTPTGAISYTYSSGSSVVTPATNTTYTVTGENIEGCTAMVESTVTVNANPVVTVNSGSICSGESFTMVPSGALSYTYSSGSAIVSPSVTASYTTTGSNSFGCESNVVNTITVSITPVISASSGAVCTGGTYTIVPSGAVTYTFSSGSAIVSPTATASYTVTGSNIDGCQSDAVLTVTVNPTLLFSANSGSVCLGSTFTMTPTGALTYTYSSGTAVVTPTASTSYTIIGENAAGCLGTEICNVAVNALPTLTVNSGAICSGQSFTIVPTGASTYTYSGGSGIVSPTITATYSITGTDGNGCVTAIDAISSVTVNANPTISATSNFTLICTGETVTLNASGATSYTWNTGVTTSSVTDTPTVTTTYTVNANDVNGCAGSSNVTVNVNDCVGIQNLSANTLSVNLYPNPTNGLITIETRSAENKNIIVTDVTGRIVFVKSTSENNFAVDLKDLNNGLYFVSIKTTTSIVSIKIIKD